MRPIRRYFRGIDPASPAGRRAAQRRTVMLRLALAAAAFLSAMAAALAAPTGAAGNDACYRCHAMATFARRAATGEIVNLSVTPEAFGHSEHHRLSCARCHGRTYQRFPHPAPARRLDCLQCHKDKPERKALFTAIGAEFRRSVHFRRHPKEFTCFRCHEPHQFHRWGEVTRLSIAQQNGVCLRCHASPDNFRRIASRRFPDLHAAHSWLPHAEVHMQQVRCLDCHSSYEPPVKSHAILAKEQAVRSCAACHAKDTVLRQKLYRYQRGRETARLGFWNAAMVNESYVIGATRNRFVDAAGAAALGLTVLAVGGYGAAIGRARRRTVPEEEGER